MEKYTIDELLARIHDASRNDLVGMLTLIVRQHVSPGVRHRMTEIIMGTSQDKTSYANLALDRSIPIGILKDLATSPMMKYLEPIIEAAMHEDGPLQSREVLMLAASIAGESKPFFITREGIPMKFRTQAGYLLSMAGFERKSHFDQTRRQPVKAWKPRRGDHFTVKQRVQLVQSIMREYLQQPAPLTLENLI